MDVISVDAFSNFVRFSVVLFSEYIRPNILSPQPSNRGQVAAKQNSMDFDAQFRRGYLRHGLLYDPDLWSLTSPEWSSVESSEYCL